MPNYKLIACDLDGTLLDPEGQVSEENLAAIHRLTERGVHFVPCTGRTLCELPDAVLSCPDIRYLIYSNGAVTLDKAVGTRELCTVTSDLADRAFAIINRYDAHLAIRAGGLYTAPQELTEEAFRHFNMYYTHVDVLQKFATGVENFRQKLAELPLPEVISLFFHSEEEMHRCAGELRALGGLTVAEPLPYNLEVFAENTGKGTALHSLADRLHIPYCETVGMGDSGNDISLLQSAGLALAVANATESLKAVCHRVICANTEHAAACVEKLYF